MGNRGVRGHRRTWPETASVVAACLVLASVTLVLLLGLGVVPAPWRSASDAERTPSHVGPSESQGVQAAVLPPNHAQTMRAVRANDVLARANTGMSTRNRVGFLSAFSSRTVGIRTQMAKVYDNTAQVPFATWKYEVVNAPNAPFASTAEADRSQFTARVALSYRFPGELSDVRRDWDMTFVHVGGGWSISKVTRAPDTPTDLWDYGRVRVVKGSRAMVLGLGNEARLRTYGQLADDASVLVDKVWGTDWPRTTVLLVPSTQKQMAAMLGDRSEKGMEQIAAVTTGEVSSTGATDGKTSRVIVNPPAMARLGKLGYQVILTHEITHAATRAASTSTVPIWLSEGFADYVAYRDAGLSPEAIAGSVRSKNHSHAELPNESDFNPREAQVDSAYATSWLAARMVSEAWSEDALVAFYRAVAIPPSGSEGDPIQSRVDAAFSSVLGTTQRAFLTEWRTYVSTAAGR